MGDFFLIIDEAGIIRYASPAAVENFGYDGVELNGTAFSRLLKIPEGDGTIEDAWLNASISPLLQGIHRSGRLFPLRLKQSEIHGGDRTHFMLSLQDPAILAANSGIFGKHEELYELATRQGRISVWEVDYRTNHLEFSPVLARLLGMSDEQIPTTVEGWIPHFHAEDWQALQRQSERARSGELPEINLECRMYHVNGTIKWTLVRGKVWFDETGAAFKTLGTCIDIGDRKEAERERDLFFSLSLDLLCIADTKGFFRRVNPAFCKRLLYDEHELTSRPFFDFVHPDDQAKTQQALAALATGENVIAFENRYLCKDGSWRWLSWTCPAVAPGSDLVYAVARDVTEARRVQEELQNAKNEAEKANRAKSEFLSRMSHELRTPLNAILGFGQLLQREALTPRLHQQIDMIVGGGRHLLDLINEVLDISRIEAGHLDLSLEPVELSGLIHEIVGLTQPMAQERGIRTIVEGQFLHERYVLADRQRLKQVLLNLISNSIKYNSDQGRVHVRGEEASPQRWRIAVQDTGPGIAREKQHRLFMPFDRLGAESTGIEGSGLGLVLSKRLIEVMGGTLVLEPRSGEGAIFSIELPRPKDPPDSTAAVAAAPPQRALPASAARSLLYIEDNPENIKLIEAVVAYRPSVRLLTAGQGHLGLEMARQHHPDLIVLDVHLPDIMGYDLLALFRADALLRSIPVVVISADATSPQIERLMDAGAKEYLTKPIDVDRFLRVLDRYLLRND